MPGERDNARNNARCTQARKATHGLDGQHQDVDRTPRGRVNQNDTGQRYVEKVRTATEILAVNINSFHVHTSLVVSQLQRKRTLFFVSCGLIYYS